MHTDRPRHSWKPILALYLGSFLLPIDGAWCQGVVCFLSALLFGLTTPSWLCLGMWAANPLLWAGLIALVRGRHGQATTFGLAGLLAASSSFVVIGDEYGLKLDAQGPLALMAFAGHLAWVASPGCVAIVGGLGWWERRGGRPPQFPLWWLMAPSPSSRSPSGLGLGSTRHCPGIRPSEAGDPAEPAGCDRQILSRVVWTPGGCGWLANHGLESPPDRPSRGWQANHSHPQKRRSHPTSPIVGMALRRVGPPVIVR